MDLAMRRMESKLDTVIRILSQLREMNINSSPPATPVDFLGPLPDLPEESEETTFLDIPAQYRFPVSEIRKIHAHSTGSGNFAKNIVVKIFPELFTSCNVRLGYSYFGGGVLAKKELDPVRKTYLERYVLFFHPELRDQNIWKYSIVPKVNEFLRRGARKAGTEL
ncbi:BEN domain-containing protein 3 [Mizuhopecten yessoensis]|uniref:BEN domain-containing protein 3 n=1 Tax=Mizuhopecten yessoensis TaxID=6573 RepID=A0A210QW67_MIZYE|nr:BEN domain-containing protein 3 [Mizuhopecten yessoensis]